VIAPAGTIIQNVRGAISSSRSSSRRLRRRVDLRVVRLHLVAALLEALRHVGAHAAEADHPELHIQVLLPVAGVMR